MAGSTTSLMIESNKMKTSWNSRTGLMTDCMLQTAQITDGVIWVKIRACWLSYRGFVLIMVSRHRATWFVPFGTISEPAPRFQNPPRSQFNAQTSWSRPTLLQIPNLSFSDSVIFSCTVNSGLSQMRHMALNEDKRQSFSIYQAWLHPFFFVCS